jgi:Holliday junction DNA helicase RuvA
MAEASGSWTQVFPHEAREAGLIGRLSGKLAGKQPPQVLIDVGGVAYELDVPMSTFYNLPATGEPVSLYTHLVVREDAHVLYGFATLEERSAFRQLIRISGIGARTALSVLSGMSVADLSHTVTMQDAAPLTRIPASARRPPSGCCSSSRASWSRPAPRRAPASMRRTW